MNNRDRILIGERKGGLGIVKRRFTPHNTKAVFFDMNNTLIDPEASFDSCFIHVLSDFAGRWDDGDGSGRGPEHVLQTYHAEWAKKGNRLHLKPEEAEEAKKQCLQTALQHYPIQVNDTFATSFFRIMRTQVRERAILFPHAADTIATLSGPYRVGLITNGSKEHQCRVIEKLNLEAYIPEDRIFASNRSGIRKPNPAIYRMALRALGVRPEDAVMIGDSWKNDVGGALSCGMKAVWLNRSDEGSSTLRKSGGKEVPVVRSLKQAAELFGI